MRIRLGRLACAAMLASLPIAAQAADKTEISIAFVGDVMLADTPGKLIRAGRDPFAPFSARLAAADIRVANLECVVSATGRPDPAKPWSFRAHPRVLKRVKRHFDAVALANNHSGDYGPRAFADMLERLEHAGIGYFGGGRTLAAAHAPLILERKGLRIALLGYNEFFPRWFEADFDKPGIAWSEDEQVMLDIEQARRIHHADIVIPVMHWGWEHEPLASDRQRQLARRMIDAGADAVVGGHPHVVQDIEIYRGRPVIYSLGNFVFDGFDTPATTTGWLLELQVDRAGARAFRTTVASIDREGTPHPAAPSLSLCWNVGQSVAGACPSRRSPESVEKE
jgi:poly-gamma-glutamate synthesis protein (capsule biosynthesis protein)